MKKAVYYFHILITCLKYLAFSECFIKFMHIRTYYKERQTKIYVQKCMDFFKKWYTNVQLKLKNNLLYICSQTEFLHRIKKKKKKKKTLRKLHTFCLLIFEKFYCYVVIFSKVVKIMCEW